MKYLTLLALLPMSALAQDYTHPQSLPHGAGLIFNPSAVQQPSLTAQWQQRVIEQQGRLRQQQMLQDQQGGPQQGQHH